MNASKKLPIEPGVPESPKALKGVSSSQFSSVVTTTQMQSQADIPNATSTSAFYKSKEIEEKLAEARASIQRSSDRDNQVQGVLNSSAKTLAEFNKKLEERKNNLGKNQASKFSNSTTNTVPSIVPSVTSIPLMPTPSSYTPAGKKY